jgi:hypothetical protein
MLHIEWEVLMMTTKPLEVDNFTEVYGTFAEIILELMTLQDGENDYLTSLLMFRGERPVGYRPCEDEDKHNINELAWSEKELINWMDIDHYQDYMQERAEQGIEQALHEPDI